MSVRSLSAAALVAATAAVAAPSAGATGGYGYAPCCEPVVVVDPCCEPDAPGLKERIALRRADRLDRRSLRLEQRADRIRGRFADDCPDCVVPVAPAYAGGYGYSAHTYQQTSYGYAGYGHPGMGYGYGY